MDDSSDREKNYHFTSHDKQINFAIYKENQYPGQNYLRSIYRKCCNSWILVVYKDILELYFSQSVIYICMSWITDVS
jgi:hypothetical protein